MYFLIYIIIFGFGFICDSTFIKIFFGLATVLEILNLRYTVKIVYHSIIHKLIFKGYVATTFGQYVITQYTSLSDRIIRHESKHAEQYRNWSVLLFLLIYVGNFLYNYVKYRDFKTAYKQIKFEIEAREAE